MGKKQGERRGETIFFTLGVKTGGNGKNPSFTRGQKGDRREFASVQRRPISIKTKKGYSGE